MVKLGDLTTTKSIELLKVAIERIQAAKKRFEELEADASAEGWRRNEAKARLSQCEHEFGWQWQNVKQVLVDLCLWRTDG